MNYKMRKIKCECGTKTTLFEFSNGVKMTWARGYMPRCTCWMARLPPFCFVPCWHVRWLADKIEHGEIK